MVITKPSVSEPKAVEVAANKSVSADEGPSADEIVSADKSVPADKCPSANEGGSASGPAAKVRAAAEMGSATAEMGSCAANCQHCFAHQFLPFSPIGEMRDSRNGCGTKLRLRDAVGLGDDRMKLRCVTNLQG